MGGFGARYSGSATFIDGMDLRVMNESLLEYI